MAQIQPTSTSSTTFETIFTAALEVYEKQTKKDVDQSQKGDEKWTKWLDPTVNVLYAFSATLVQLAGAQLCPASCVRSRPARWVISHPKTLKEARFNQRMTETASGDGLQRTVKCEMQVRLVQSLRIEIAEWQHPQAVAADCEAQSIGVAHALP
ncbi:hypothetical protein V8E53_012815 [Lactarius tabidus]